MDTLINDIMGPPRKRSRNPAKSPLRERKPNNDPSKSTMELPAQAYQPTKTLPGTFDHGAASSLKAATELETPAEVPLPPEEPSEALALQEAASSDIPAPAELPPDAGLTQIKESLAAEELAPNEGVAQVEEGLTTKGLQHDEGFIEDEATTAPEEEMSPVATLTILEPTPVVHSHPAILIGISGATASGKTVLSHLLSSVVPSTTTNFIVHQNDFFIPKHFLSPNESGGVDSDCPEAIDFPALVRVLKYAKREGTLPPGHRSGCEGDEHELASSLVAQGVVGELKEILAKSEILSQDQPVCIVTGFLLYHSPEVRDILDIKLYLRANREAAKNRRFQKPYYAAEGSEHDFWTTRPYFDQTVWPNYVHEHGPLFKHGDVEGRPLFDLCNKLNIIMQPQLDMSAEQILRWATASIPMALQGPSERMSGQTRDLDQDKGPNPEVSFLRKYEACDCSEGWLGRVRKVLYDIV